MSDETRDFVQARLRQVRELLATITATLTEERARTIEVTPEWSALDGLRHILAWQNLTVAALDDWMGQRHVYAEDHDPDPINAQLLAETESLDLPGALARIEANLYRFETTLATGDDELAEVALAPWGSSVSRLMALSGILWHDREHLNEIAAAVLPHQP